MYDDEIKQFETQFGYKPTRVCIAIDGLGVFVSKNNPVKGLTLTELDAMYSTTLKRGGRSITQWGQLGLTGEWANRPVALYGLRSGAGANALFADFVLKGGDFRPSMHGEFVSSSVVQGVGVEAGGVGFASVFYQTRRTRLVPLSADGTNYYKPTMEHCLSGKYPLARFLILHVNRKPGTPLDAPTLELHRYMLSRQGQESVMDAGSYPLPAQTIAEQLALVE